MTQTLAVLWDMDGVLIDSEPLLLEAERAAFAEHGVELTAESKKPFVGLGGHEVMARMADAFGLAHVVDELNEAKFRNAHRLLPSVQSFPQTRRLVDLLSDAEIPMAVASGSSPEMIMLALVGTGLGKKLHERVSALEVDRGKPAPDVFLEAARRLGVEARHCVVIEDAVPGIQAARAAGMRSIGIPYVTDPWDERFEQADLVIRGGMGAVDADAVLRWVLSGSDTADPIRGRRA